MSSQIEFDCLQVAQPIGTFYLGVLTAADLYHISYSDIRELQAERELDRYMGIERPLSPARVKKLRRYVENIDATFPTSVILAIPSSRASDLEDGLPTEIARYCPEKKKMTIARLQDVAKIIDGQHRIAALENVEDRDFQIPVTIFIDMELEDQAMVFATINLEQTKVSKSLMYDLYEYAEKRSPQKTCHNIARLLNREDGSPFQDRIKILGVAEHQQQTLTQAAFVDRLLKYISADPMKDRNLLKQDRSIDPDESRIFREFFRKEEDAVIARIVWNYFKAVESKWPNAWREKKQGNILNRTNGFSGLMRFLEPAYKASKKDEKGVAPIKEFSRILEQVTLGEDDFTSDEYKPGSSGASKLYRELMDQTALGER